MTTVSSDPSAWAAWPIDREIVIVRVLDAPREAVFDAWTDPAQITAWFGPAGMTVETREIDIREGGVWRFDMVAADGTRYCQEEPKSPQSWESNFPHPVKNQDSVDSSARTRPAFSFSFSR